MYIVPQGIFRINVNWSHPDIQKIGEQAKKIFPPFWWEGTLGMILPVMKTTPVQFKKRTIFLRAKLDPPSISN